MQQIAIIPARYASVRLPGKPLIDICGKPMLLRVYEQASRASVDRVIIATDDQRIFDAMTKMGCEVCMTSETHRSGTDRLSEVVTKLQIADDTIIVNVQGDEPLIPPQAIDQVSELLMNHPKAVMSTLSTSILDKETLEDPNVVKVVSNQAGEAIYFSRAVVPFDRDKSHARDDAAVINNHYQRHIGIYAYRADFIKQYSHWDACEMEKTESLEQLRILWHGGIIQIDEAVVVPPEGVDTEADLAKIRALISDNNQ